MKEFACRKCGSAMLFIKDNGIQVGLYCSDCGAWQKWLGKDEQRLAEQWIEHMNSTKSESNGAESVSNKIFKYSVEYKNCHYQNISKHGYVFAKNEIDAKDKLKDEYDYNDVYIEETNIIEL